MGVEANYRAICRRFGEGKEMASKAGILEDWPVG